MIRRLLLLLALLPVVGCESGPPASIEAPLVFIGVDSADWTWIDPLIEEGRMPRIEGLIERGVRAPLTSLVPLQKSPTIWTSIATGKRPAKHGIADFITHDSKVQTSDLRSAAAYWEILGHLGHRQAVLGWWVTYPATYVNGVLVSDFLPYIASTEREDENAVYPPQEWERMASLVVHPDDVDDEMLARFVDVDAVRAHDQDRMLDPLREYIAGDLTYLRIAEDLYAREDFGVFTVYFRGLDMASHQYWRWFQPNYSGIDPSDWRVDAFSRVIEAYYEFSDDLVGEVLDIIDPESRVVLVSDHGFVGHRRKSGAQTLGVDMHRDTGILVLAGPGVRSGARIAQAEVKDVMPTMLVMMGVPTAADFDGHVLLDVFDGPERRFAEDLAQHELPTYEGVIPRAGQPVEVSDEVNEAVIERLRSLGYIE